MKRWAPVIRCGLGEVERPERARRSSLMLVGAAAGAAAGVGRRSCIWGVTLRVALQVGLGVWVGLRRGTGVEWGVRWMRIL